MLHQDIYITCRVAETREIYFIAETDGRQVEACLQLSCLQELCESLRSIATKIGDRTFGHTCKPLSSSLQSVFLNLPHELSQN